ncbi:MAG TPA: alpha/beta fold hydrolase, partial [Caldilineaceae bacterium]|nr:alpha/beta fold hydrolase [Caldilineaceae bacterium]
LAILAWQGYHPIGQAQSRPLPQIEEADCFVEPPQDIGIIEEVECGYLVVPERRDVPTEQTVRVAYMRYRTAAEDAGEPVVYLAGGPGDSGILNVAEGSWLITILLLTRDVITFDQRGTGHSIPSLNCVDWYDELVNLPEMELPADGISGCRDYWTAKAIDLSAYTTTESAADVADLLSALGYEQAILLGASYGSKLALVTMRNHPAQVAAAVLDGVVPVELNQEVEHFAKMADAFERVFALCEADQACETFYPALRTRFYTQVARLDANPATLTLTAEGERWEEPLTGFGLLNGLYLHLFSGAEAVAEFPYRVAQVERGDYSYLAGLFSDISVSDPLAGSGLYNTIHCAEEVLLTTPEELQASIEAYPRLAAALLASGPDALTSIFDECKSWGVAAAGKEFATPVASDIPTLILQGGLDFQTPISWALQARRGLSNSQLVYLPTAGHVSSMEDSCAASLVAQFAADPEGRLDTSCLDRLPALVFYIPELAPEAAVRPVVVVDGQGEAQASTVVPANWWLAGEWLLRDNAANVYAPYDASQSLSFAVWESKYTPAEIAYELTGVEGGTFEEWTVEGRTWQVGQAPATSAWSSVVAVHHDGERAYSALLEGIFLDWESALHTVLRPALAELRTGPAILDPFQWVRFVDEESGLAARTVAPPDWRPEPDDPLAYTAVDGNTALYFTFLGPEEIVGQLAGEWTGEEEPFIKQLVVGEHTWALFSAYEDGWSYLYAVAQDRRGTYVLTLVGDFFDVWGQGYDYLKPMMAGFSVARG